MDQIVFLVRLGGRIGQTLIRGGFAEGILALVRREGKYAKGHLEGWYGIIKRSKYCETELMMKCTNQITS